MSHRVFELLGRTTWFVVKRAARRKVASAAVPNRRIAGIGTALIAVTALAIFAVKRRTTD